MTDSISKLVQKVRKTNGYKEEKQFQISSA